jgi:hypothetical protein
MSCKTKITCTGQKTYAVCAEYESQVNLESYLDENSCISVEEALEDIYKQLPQIDVTDLNTGCLTYTLDTRGKLIVSKMLEKHAEEICSLKTEIESLKETTLCNTAITDCNLDFGDLVTACGSQPRTVKELFQLLLNQHITP